MDSIGRYRLDSELGRGAMGVVYRGFDPRMNRRVAVKVIRLDHSSTDEQKADSNLRFAREAAAAGNLSHPNIVAVYDSGEQGDLQYIVLELVDGQSLEKTLPSGVPQDRKAAVSVLTQVAGALDHAHGKGIIHRDVKPANILVCPDGAVKITDFGIARITDQTITRTGLTVGTPAYMAPEQIMSGRVDGKADQFSLAVMAYQMLSGRMPFVAAGMPALMHKIVYEEPPALRDWTSAYPPRTSEVLKKGLAKDPERRYATCAEFVRDLAAALEEGKPTAAPVPPVRRYAEPPKIAEKPAEAEQTTELVERASPPPRAPLGDKPGGLSYEPPAPRPRVPPGDRPRGLSYAIGLGAAAVAAAILLWFFGVFGSRLPVTPPPGVAQFTANPASIQPGQAATLRWQVDRSATGVSIDHGVGAVQNSGDYSVTPRESTTYKLTATGPGGASSASATVSVAAPSPPAPGAPAVAQFTAEPASIQRGQASTLSWQVDGDATSVSIDRGVGAVQKTGSRSVSPVEPTTYTLTAGGPGGTTKYSVTVGVAAPPPVAPVVAQFTADPVSIQRGQSSTLHWQVDGNSTSVSIDHAVGAVQNAGSRRVTPGESTTYTLTAAGPGGTARASATVGVTAPPPPAPVVSQFTAEPASIQRGGSSTLNWQVSGNATGVSIDQGIGTVPSAGSRRVSPSEPTTYTLAVVGPGGTTSASATVRVTAPPPPAPVVSQFTAEPASIQRGGSSTLSWQVGGNATGVSIDQGIGTVPSAGSRRVTPVEPTTYTVTAVGPGGNTSASATVRVTAPPLPNVRVAEPPSPRVPVPSPSPPPAEHRAGDTKTEGDGLKYMWIPPGTFTMGCSPGDSECDSDEKPAHQVTITKGFWLGQTDVTQAAYRRVVGKSPSHFKGDNLPVEQVNWNEAQSYCQKIGGRLPTEAEWEYAARAGSTVARYGAVDDIAWTSSNSGKKTHPVGTKQQNAFGLFDMLGNVYQWTVDWYAEKYYQSSGQQDPAGPATGTYRTLRGGSWSSLPRDARASYRIRDVPDDRYYVIGFRCVGE